MDFFLGVQLHFTIDHLFSYKDLAYKGNLGLYAVVVGLWRLCRVQEDRCWTKAYTA